MLSDGQILERGLRRLSCLSCGLARHADPPGAEELQRLFASGYGLYAHPPGEGRETLRQESYAKWIVAALAGLRPGIVLELGSGNGSLLLELAKRWPGAELAGIEPSEAAAAQARAAGLDVSRGFAEDLPASGRICDVAISVNVVEHARDPLAFLRSARARLRPGGTAILVCPDGERPSMELLFFDHLHSFTAAAFERMLARAGLRLRRTEAAPGALGAFRMYVSEAANPARAAAGSDPRALAGSRARYLAAWAALDDALLERAHGATSLTCFGAGETASLLRAYAPRSWTRVRRMVVDEPTASHFAGLPVLATADLELTADEAMLLAVRPQDQARVQQRMQHFGRIIRWDDILSA
ncbi:MAG: class I SAM-dependent methyltransferase [Burkholderiales bacterium]